MPEIFYPYRDLVPSESGDKILALGQEAAADTRQNVINATIGIYRNPDGTPHVFETVAEAWKHVDLGKAGYLPAEGDPTFIKGTAEMIFGKWSPLMSEKRLATLGTVGGTGALAMWAAFHRKTLNTPVLMSNPTWANHPQIFSDRGLMFRNCPHLDGHKYNQEAHQQAIKEAPPGTVVLFHTGKTHNPTGVNPQIAADWGKLADSMDGKQALFDTAYAGFGRSIPEDTAAIRIFMDKKIPVVVAVSFAKNMGIYRERPGALLIPTETPREAGVVQEYLKSMARVTWSTPPAQGERVAAHVMQNSREGWERELMEVYLAIGLQRKKLVQALGPEFRFLSMQAGLFSLLPLSETQVARLKDEHAVYILSDGRVNVMGVPVQHMERFAEAVKAVM